MIHNAVIHLNGEQPLIADLFELPSPDDVCLRCTNLRQLNGKRPVFADDMASVFFFPYLHIRFVEVSATAAIAAGIDLPMPVAVASAVAPPEAVAPLDAEADLEIDEDLMRRIREA